jgi:hypothetical protein
MILSPLDIKVLNHIADSIPEVRLRGGVHTIGTYKLSESHVRRLVEAGYIADAVSMEDGNRGLFPKTVWVLTDNGRRAIARQREVVAGG